MSSSSEASVTSSSAASSSSSSSSYADTSDEIVQMAAKKFGSSSVVARVVRKKRFKILRKRDEYAADLAVADGSVSESYDESGVDSDSDVARANAKGNKKITLEDITESEADRAIVSNIQEDFKTAHHAMYPPTEWGWTAMRAPDIETVLDVHVPHLAKQFGKASSRLAKKRPTLDRNNFVVRRMYHGTQLACSLGIDGNTTPCTLSECRLCSILRDGFSLEHVGTNERQHPIYPVAPGAEAAAPEVVVLPAGDESTATDATDATATTVGSASSSPDVPANRWGKALCFSEFPTSADEYATCYRHTPVGKRGRIALLVCQVAVGKSAPLWYHTEGVRDPAKRRAPPKGYDAIMGMPADLEHTDAPLGSPEVAIYDATRALVTQVVIYTRGDVQLCPRCGVRVNYAERVHLGIKNKLGWFCSKRCGREFARALKRMRKFVRKTPKRIENTEFGHYWEPTDSDAMTQLIDLWPGSLEATMIAMELRKTLPEASLVKVFRVQNGFLYEKYWEELQRVRRKNGGDANEMLLFHGTSGTDPSFIYDSEEGFDPRFSTWGMWGRGSYFARNASYSNGYAYSEPSGYRTMFLAKVIIGEAADMAPDSDLDRPPKKSEQLNNEYWENQDKPNEPGKQSHLARKMRNRIKKHKHQNRKLKLKHERYDSVTGWTGGSRVFITYKGEKQYPAYLITYKTY